MSTPKINQNFFKIACLFEGSLILVALVIGWLTDIDPFAAIHFSEADIFTGLVATIPLFLLFMMLYLLPTESLQQMKTILLETLGPMMHKYHWSDLLILAAVAGISEEILFRGVLQPWMENAWGATAGLIGSNIVFGLVHAVTPLYAFLAASVGIYLGLLLDYGDQRNLITPIVVHSFYDFLAFLVIMRTYRTEYLTNKDVDDDGQ